MSEPVLQWVGGKRRILDIIKSNYPKKYNKYYEIFLGGGAVLFNTEPKNALCFEKNKNLTDMYDTIKYNVEQLYTEFQCLIIKYETIELVKNDTNMRKFNIHDHNELDSKQIFYMFKRTEFNTLIEELKDIYTFEDSVKKNKSKDYIKKTALLLFLNRTCFNGIYRENSSGEFNVPFGNGRSSVVVLESYKNVINNMHKYLMTSGTKIINGDFEEVLKYVEARDFVYMDPPYYPINEQSFTGYDKSGFNKDDHERVIELCKTLNSKGVYTMLSNSNTPWIRDKLRLPSWKITDVAISRSLNSKVKERGKTNCEVLVINY